MTCLRRGLSPSAVPLLFAVASLASSLRAAPAAAPKDGLDSKVDIRVRQAPLARLLDSLSAQAKVNFILGEGLEDKKVTAFLQGVSVREVLDVLKEARGIDYRRVAGSDTYLIAPKDSPQLLDPAVVEGGAALDQRVTVRVKHAPLDQFLDTLAAQTKVNFILDEGLEDRRVTAYLKNVKLREALEIVLTIKGLTCRKLDGKDAHLVGKRRP